VPLKRHLLRLNVARWRLVGGLTGSGFRAVVSIVTESVKYSANSDGNFALKRNGLEEILTAQGLTEKRTVAKHCRSFYYTGHKSVTRCAQDDDSQVIPRFPQKIIHIYHIIVYSVIVDWPDG
jgi:hypothetical protein